MKQNHHRAMRMKNPEFSPRFGGKGRRVHGPMDGGGRPNGRRRRQFDSDSLRTMVLSLIGEGASHGYELIRAFEERSGGAYVPSPGVIYPLLTLLNETGLVDAQSEDGGRKCYQLTDAGRAESDSKAEATKILFERLAALAEKAERVDPTPVRRAMQGLKMALMDRLGRDDTTPETVFAAVALVDAATREIERL